MFSKLVKNVLKMTNTYTDVFGVEFELEASNLPRTVKGWTVTTDGSLRNGLEYVTNEPVDLAETIKRIEVLKKATANSTIDDNGYAGTHVHVNVGDLTVTQMFNFIILYLSMENIIAKKYFGEDREGNLFCLRLADAEYLGYLLTQAVREENLKLLNTDDIRYSSLNLNALFKYGTLEFRGLRGDGDFDKAIKWVQFLAELKQEAKRIVSPLVLLNMTSETGAGFATKWFPDLSKEERHEILRGMRRVQNLVYESDWS